MNKSRIKKNPVSSEKKQSHFIRKPNFTKETADEAHKEIGFDEWARFY